LAKAITSVYERDVPSASLYFQKRLSSLTVGLSRVEVSIYRFRKRFKGRSVAVTEPVADYLLKSLGLRIATPFRLQSTIMNGVDPSPENIAYQEQLLLRRRVGALVYNTQVTSQATTLFREDAQQAHVPVVGVYEIMPSTFSTYQQWMVSTIASIARALTSNHQRNLR
jgi:zinc/manganese transport system substrate-binding protein